MVCMCRIKAVAFVEDGSTKEDQFTFRTNSVPYGGSCSVSPVNGTAIDTEFNITCNGWQDDDLPLTYEFRYHTNTGMVVITKGSEANVTTRLPVGDPLKDFVITIETQIIDHLGASEMYLMAVYVRTAAVICGQGLMSLFSV